MKLSYILDSIDLGTIALPEFQRGYVWTRKQVRELMQSLYQRYPVGGLLLWQTRVGVTATRGGSLAEGATVTLLLDGQQRITSLYGIIRGRPPEFFDGNAETFTGLHFDVENETFEFYQPSKMSGRPEWVDVTALMQTGLGRWFDQLQGHPRFGTLMERLSNLKGVVDCDFREESLSGEDKTVDVVVEVFNRVNSGGTILSKGDLALARICAEWPAGRRVMREHLEKWRRCGFDFSLDWLLRTTNAVVTGEAQFTVLRTVDPERFQKGLDRTCYAVDSLLNLVAGRLGLDHDRVLAGRLAFPVMARSLVVDHGGNQPSAAEQDRLLYWYVQSFIWGRYSGTTETTINRDLEVFRQDGVAGLIRELERWRWPLRVRPDDFDVSSVGARIYPLLYLLTRTHSARDWGNGNPLSAHLLGHKSRLELHHIFPKALLKEHGYARSEVNAVANFCFQTQETNRAIGRDDPEEYLPEIAARHPGALESQWVPTNPALWSLERYPQFLAARRALLADTANAFLDSLRSGAPRPPVVLAPAPAGDSLVETAEDVELRELADEIVGLGLAKPELHVEIDDPDSGENQATADALWRSGLQEGLTEPVAFLLEPDAAMETRLRELGYRCFTSRASLLRHAHDLTGLTGQDAV
ncbi:MAG: GmrSD restriction endonuclease domain-containing protein [Egibacteraceae bacterium]